MKNVLGVVELTIESRRTSGVGYLMKRFRSEVAFPSGSWGQPAGRAHSSRFPFELSVNLHLRFTDFGRLCENYVVLAQSEKMFFVRTNQEVSDSLRRTFRHISRPGVPTLNGM